MLISDIPPGSPREKTYLFRHVDALLGGLEVGDQLRDVLAALVKYFVVN